MLPAELHLQDEQELIGMNRPKGAHIQWTWHPTYCQSHSIQRPRGMRLSLCEIAACDGGSSSFLNSEKIIRKSQRSQWSTWTCRPKLLLKLMQVRSSKYLDTRQFSRVGPREYRDTAPLLTKFEALSIVCAFNMHCAAFTLPFKHSRAVRIVGEIWGTAVSNLIAHDSPCALHTLLDVNSSNCTSTTDTLVM